MRKNSPQYKEWKKRQDKKRSRHRQQRQDLKRNRNRIPVRPVAEDIRKEETYPKSEKKFSAPSVFSLQDNAAETTSFFNGIVRFIKDKHNYGKMIFFDISSVTKLTSDALMYLLAIITNLNHKLRKYRFSGNAPTDPSVQQQFEESGFYKYVRRRGNRPLKENKDILQIESGDTCSTMIAKQISDFVCEQANLSSPRKCGFLYDISIELLSNTCKHAYGPNKNDFLRRWYYFVKRINQDTLSFVFLDTGEGIPATVQRNFAEKIDVLNIIGDSNYVISAFNGDFRTATQESYRGRGLPKLRSYCTSDTIQNFRIITNRADIKVLKSGYDEKNMPTSLCGTLYSWTINIPKLRGEM